MHVVVVFLHERMNFKNIIICLVVSAKLYSLPIQNVRLASSRTLRWFGRPFIVF